MYLTVITHTHAHISHGHGQLTMQRHGQAVGSAVVVRQVRQEPQRRHLGLGRGGGRAVRQESVGGKGGGGA